MNGTRVVIIMIIVFVVALFLGFLMGSKRVADVRKELSALKTDFETKMTALQDDLAKAKAQKELSVCRWELVQVRTDASRRDFGQATESLAVANEAFGRALALSKTNFFEKLALIQPSFEEIKAGLDKNDIKTVGMVEELITKLDTIISE